VDGAGSAFGVGGFTREEQRAAQWSRESRRRLDTADSLVAVRAARKRIVLPVV